MEIARELRGDPSLSDFFDARFGPDSGRSDRAFVRPPSAPCRISGLDFGKKRRSLCLVLPSQPHEVHGITYGAFTSRSCEAAHGRGSFINSMCSRSGSFILALLSKPMAVTLPVVLLILDWYPFNRIRSSAAVSVHIRREAPLFRIKPDVLDFDRYGAALGRRAANSGHYAVVHPVPSRRPELLFCIFGR